MFSGRFPGDSWPVGLLRSKEVNFWAREKKNTAFHTPRPRILCIPFAGLNEVFKTKGIGYLTQHVFACTHWNQKNLVTCISSWVWMKIRLVVLFVWFRWFYPSADQKKKKIFLKGPNKIINNSPFPSYLYPGSLKMCKQARGVFVIG